MLLTKKLGKMITIDFFDANGRFVVRHIVEMEPMRTFPFIWARVYCKQIFYWYKSANSATITINGVTQGIQRYGQYYGSL